MESLKSYISIIDPRLLNQLSGKPAKFIRLFQQGKFFNEEAFINVICGEKYDRKYYGSLKSRTIKALQILAFMSGSEGANQVKKKYEICQKKFFLGQKFLAKSERLEGIKLIKQAYRIAIGYDFVHLASEIASILYHHHIYYDKNDKRAEFFAGQVEKYANAYLAEKKAEHCLFQVLKHTGKSVKPEMVQKAILQVEQNKGSSIKYKVYEAVLKVHYGFHIMDYDLVIQSCNNTLQFFNNKKGVYNSHYWSFLKNRGVAQMAIGQYDNAETSFQQADKYSPRKSINDYLVRFYRTLNALRSGEYQTAYDLYKQNRRCRFEIVREQFAIIEAYLCFLACTGYLQFNRPFRLGKYLNDTFKAQGDKQGDNVNILIAELLVYLARDRGKFIDRIEAIKHYSYRHLNAKDTRRAKWFIKILCLLPNANFHPIALERRAKTYITNLKKHPTRMGENFAIEVIPFEKLLDMIITQLKRKVA